MRRRGQKAKGTVLFHLVMESLIHGFEFGHVSLKSDKLPTMSKANRRIVDSHPRIIRGWVSAFRANQLEKDEKCCFTTDQL